MDYISKDEFTSLLRTQDHESLVDEYLFRGVPFAFRERPEEYNILLEHIATSLDVPRTSITLVGSGRIGFSLNPDKFGASFSDKSDLDILVVSDLWFDRIWLDFLRWNRRNYFNLSPQDKVLITRNRIDIYWGRLWPDSLPQVTQLAAVWFNAFRSISLNPDLAKWEVNGRLYRTWDHARLYQLWTLAQLERQAR